MGFQKSARVIDLDARLESFMREHVYPREHDNVADRAMQVFGGKGVCQDTLIPTVFTRARFCRIADGPDEVHMSQLAKLTIKQLTGS